MSKSHIYPLVQTPIEQDDQLSFKRIYMEFYPRLLIFSQGYIKDRQASEDIVEDIFMKLWDNRNSLSHIKNLKFYLYVSAKNACLNYLTVNKKIQSEDLDCINFELGPISVSAEDIYISEERIKLIQSSIQTLPPKCKSIFILIKEEGLKYAEVAELLNISIKTVEAQMTIALKKLSAACKVEFPEFVSNISRRKSV